MSQELLLKEGNPSPEEKFDNETGEQDPASCSKRKILPHRILDSKTGQ
jgi:hypothetical protein